MTAPTQPQLFDPQADLSSEMVTDAQTDGLDAILSAVLALSPAERDLLWRRLRAVGLLPSAGDVTDRSRLAVAPAVANKRAGGKGSSATTDASDSGSTPAADGSRFVAPIAPISPSTPPTRPPTGPTALSLFPADASKSAADPAQPYRSTVSGKVVVKSSEPAAQPSPHDMAPLPGQAPEQPIGVVFDGGSKGNPGQGYGSYALRWPGQAEQIVKLRFGNQVTNNEAEYDTLIAALEAILARLQDMGADPKSARVHIRGDSLLVINQIKGEWKCKQDHLRVRRDKARTLLKRIGSWQLTHHDRSNSVRILGH